MGVAAGIAQAATDFFFHPELTPGQRVGRVLVGAAVGVIAVAAAPAVLTLLGGAALTGAAATAATFIVASAIGFGLQEFVVRPRIYPILNLGR